MEKIWREERKDGTRYRSDEGIYGDRAVAIEAIGVDDVVHALPVANSVRMG